METNQVRSTFTIRPGEFLWDLNLPTTRDAVPRDRRTSPSASIVRSHSEDADWASSSASKHSVPIFGHQADDYWRVVSEGSRWHRVVAARLNQLSLQSDHPDYPSIELLNTAWSLIDDLLPPSTATPSVTPSEDGGVELFWQKRGWDVIVEISRADYVTVWTRDRKTGDEAFGVITERREELRDILADISAD